jgi:Methyltransferase domain
MLQKFTGLGGRSVRLFLSGNSPTADRKNDRRKGIGALRIMHRRPLLRPHWAWSPRRINALAKGLNANRYLEIGVEHGYTVENVRVGERIGVDPNPRFDVTKLPKGFSFFAVESDAYFASLSPESIFDIAFIDGLHTFEQTKADLFNVLAHVPSGVILIDDTVPLDEIAAIPDEQDSLARRRAVGSDETRWMGDVWKLVVYIDRYLPQLDFRTIVGSGNEQTLVWRRQPGEVVSEPLVDEEATIAGLRYGEILGEGIPASFKPCTEDEAIRACLAWVGPRQDP